MAHPIQALLGALALLAAPPAPPPARPAGPPPRAPGSPPASAVQLRVLFDIATASGAAASTWASLAYDREHDELFAAFGGQVHVYNAAAMETYAFGGDGDVGLVERVAVLESGEMLLLSNVGGHRTVLRADFRGDPLGRFEPTPLPADYAGFDPDRLLVQGQRVYLVEAGKMRVVVTDLDARVMQTIDLASLVHDKDPNIQLGMIGFWADELGNLVFTMPLSFSAFVMTPSGDLTRFGVRGSSPGKFNVVGAVARDEAGNYFILDRLRSVVLIFDPSLKFLTEFGYRGDEADNLTAPYEVAVGNGKIFVSQARDRGVKVFRYQITPRPAAAPGGDGA